MFENASLAIPVLGIIALVVLAVAVVVRRIRVAGPNEAFIITGRKGKTTRNEAGGTSTDLSGQKVVMGASVFVLPFVQQLHVIDLSSRGISVSIKGAVSAHGVKVDLDGVAIVKVGGNEDLIRAAAQRFLNQQNAIESFTQEVLAGSLRSIVGGLTVEEIIRDRAAFAAKVAEESEVSLTGQGLVLDAFQIQDVRTEGSYLDDLGRPEQARVRQDASIAEARARQASEKERLLAEEAIAGAERDLALKKASITAETDAAGARADLAGPLARAAEEQALLAEQEKVAVRTAALKERQLDTEVRKPADADRYRIEQAAEADKYSAVAKAEGARQAKISSAQATAEESRLLGEGERARRAALAEATQIEGQAEGAAIEARGTAEAATIREKADAFARYNDAAVLQMIVAVLPEMVAQASAPLSNVDNLTVISADGTNALPRQVASNLSQGLQILNDVAGVDVKALLQRFAAAEPTSAAIDVPKKPAPPAE
jgi:flotillin